MLCSTLLPAPQARCPRSIRSIASDPARDDMGAVMISSNTQNRHRRANRRNAEMRGRPGRAPRVSARGAAMKLALLASAHSGRTSDQSTRPPQDRRHGIDRGSQTEPAGPQGAGPGSRPVPASHASGRDCRPARVARPRHRTAEPHPSWCRAARRRTRYRAGWRMPRCTRPTRTIGSFNTAAATLALLSPVWPPQAPQSSPAACGLFTVLLPCPTSSTSPANSRVIDMARRTASAASSRAALTRPEARPPNRPGAMLGAHALSGPGSGERSVRRISPAAASSPAVST